MISEAALRAKELLDLAGTPSALVTGTFLAFASRTIAANKETVDHTKMWFALLAASGAAALMAALVAVMTPLALRSVFVYRARVETILLVYWVVFLSAVGTLGYAAFIVVKCTRELGRPAD